MEQVKRLQDVALGGTFDEDHSLEEKGSIAQNWFDVLKLGLSEARSCCEVVPG